MRIGYCLRATYLGRLCLLGSKRASPQNMFKLGCGANLGGKILTMLP